MDIQQIEAKLWQAADKLRGNISSSDYKYVILGLIFLKYISDAFDVQYKKAESEGFDPEDRDFYLADNVFWVPKEARWENLVANAKQPTIGVLIDDAMDAVERDNPTLKGVLPKNYAREALDKRRLGELIDLFTNAMFKVDNAKDLLGQVYEYFMGMFAASEGKHGGEFYTPRSIVQLLVEMLEPYNGRIYDPACGSGGMFVWSEKFVEEHSGRLGDIAVYGQELNETTWRLGKMNMAIRGIDAELKRGDTFHDDKFPDLKADYIIANPPFNISDWGQEHLRDDIRWKYGLPPKGNANYAWVQHIINHLSPNGTAGFVIASSSMNSQNGGEDMIRRKILKADLVDCIVTLPSQLFFNTGIPACLWFISRDRANRRGKILFIEGQNLGTMVTRRHRELTPEDITLVTSTYHNFKTQNDEYRDMTGLCKVATLEEVKENNYVLSPSRYVLSTVGSLIVHKDIDSVKDREDFAKLSSTMTKKLEIIENDWHHGSTAIRIQDVIDTQNNAQSLQEFLRQIYEDLIIKYFDTKQNLVDLPAGWERRRFDSLFNERKLRVKELDSCPEIFSVTNMGIQSRNEKYSKELSKGVDGYKVAFRGDMVFGLSREIPNLDVLLDEIGAFSPAYTVYEPVDVRTGLIIGTIMRLRLMEQADILKGGAREGRGLDKAKLGSKTYVVPNEDILNELWGRYNYES